MLDASAAYEFLLRTAVGKLVAARLYGFRLVHAPHLLDVEVASSLRRAVAKGWVTSERARAALEDLQVMNVARYTHTPHLARIWDLRHNFSAYDACYLALAEALGATLLTCDAALGEAKLRGGVVEIVSRGYS